MYLPWKNNLSTITSFVSIDRTTMRAVSCCWDITLLLQLHEICREPAGLWLLLVCCKALHSAASCSRPRGLRAAKGSRGS